MCFVLDYDKGEACYEAPSGTIGGEITSKWQYKIQNGKLIYAFESDTKIDDEILKQELGNNGDVQLKNIVHHSERAKYNYQEHERPDTCHSRGGRKWKNFCGASSDCLSFIPRQGKSESVKYTDPIAQQCVFGLHFPYFTGAWRGTYPGNEF